MIIASVQEVPVDKINETTQWLVSHNLAKNSKYIENEDIPTVKHVSIDALDNDDTYGIRIYTDCYKGVSLKDGTRKSLNDLKNCGEMAEDCKILYFKDLDFEIQPTLGID